MKTCVLLSIAGSISSVRKPLTGHNRKVRQFDFTVAIRWYYARLSLGMLPLSC